MVKLLDWGGENLQGRFRGWYEGGSVKTLGSGLRDTGRRETFFMQPTGFIIRWQSCSSANRFVSMGFNGGSGFFMVVTCIFRVCTRIIGTISLMLMFDRCCVTRGTRHGARDS